MATATIKFVGSTKSPSGDVTQDCVTYYGTVTVSAAGDTYVTGGMAPLTGFAFKNLGAYGDRTPLFVEIASSNGSSMVYIWNQTTGKLQVFTGNSSASGVTSAPELTNGTAMSGTTPAINTDVITFRATFPKTVS
jgi:hypothetical protein